MKKLPAILFLLSFSALSAWIVPYNLTHKATLRIGDRVIYTLDNTTVSEVVPLDRSLLKESETLSASMEFAGYVAQASSCKIVITNEDSKTLTGVTKSCTGKEFMANLPIHEILSHEEFAHAKALNIFIDITNSGSDAVDGTFLLGRFQFK